MLVTLRGSRVRLQFRNGVLVSFWALAESAVF